MAAYVTDRPGGFSEREIADLSVVSERLSIVADMNSQRQIAETVLKAYLGPQTGRKVLAGQIRRGSGEAIAAVLWSSDLRSPDRIPRSSSGPAKAIGSPKTFFWCVPAGISPAAPFCTGAQARTVAAHC
jgi:hypothetical protein